MYNQPKKAFLSDHNKPVLLHGFSIESNGDGHPYTVGIIENPDGQLTTVAIERIIIDRTPINVPLTAIPRGMKC